MIYLILKISIFLTVAAAIGVVAGWLLRQIAAKEREEKLGFQLNATRSRIPQLETRARKQEQKASRLLLEVNEWKSKLPALESTLRENEKLLRERDRTIAALNSELGILREHGRYQEDQENQQQWPSILESDAGYSERMTQLQTERDASVAALKSVGEKLEKFQQLTRQLTAELKDSIRARDALRAELHGLQQTQTGSSAQRSDPVRAGQIAQHVDGELRQIESALKIRDEHIKELDRRIQDQAEEMADVLNSHTSKVAVLNQLRTEQETTISQLQQHLKERAGELSLALSAQKRLVEQHEAGFFDQNESVSEPDTEQQIRDLSCSLEKAMRDFKQMKKERERQEITLLILNQQLVEARDTSQRLAAERAKWKKAASNSHTPEPPRCLYSAAPEKIDDFTQIKGIGKAAEAALNGLGIYQFRQLIELRDQEIAWVDTHLKRLRGRIVRDDWIGQAIQLQSNSC